MTGADLIATADAVVAWLLTYVVHSTVLLLAAWLASALLRGRRLAIQDAVWKAALLGGLATASLQIAVAPGAPVVVIRSLAPAAASAPVSAGASLAPSAGIVNAPTATVPGGGAAEVEPTGWSVPIILVWLAGAAGFGLALVVSALGLHRLVRDRRAVEHGALGQLFARLLARTGRHRSVALSECGAIETPFAFGVLRSEVCVPERVTTDLAPRLQEGLLAHELGHVLRRDPTWLTVGRVIEGVFFFQPLNRLARRRLEELSEYLCDDWAVSQTGRGIALARCLAEVAAWTHGDRVRHLGPGRAGVAALAGDGSPLARRVGRIMNRNRHSEADSRRPLWTIPTVLAALAAVVLFAPGAVSSPPAPDAAPAPPVVTAAAAPIAPIAVPAADAVAPVEPAPAASVAPVASVDPPAPADPPAVPEEPAPAAAPADPAPAADAGTIEDEVRREVERSRGDRERVRELKAEIRRTAREMRPQRDEMERLARELARTAARGREISAEERERMSAHARALAEQHGLSEEQRRALEKRAQEFATQHRLSEDRLQELRKQAQELAERRGMSESERQELRKRVQELAEQHRIERREIREQARALAQAAPPTAEERERAVEEARRMHEEMQLNRAELDRLRAEARRVAEASRPSVEELQRLQQELAELQRHLEQELAKEAEKDPGPPLK